MGSRRSAGDPGRGRNPRRRKAPRAHSAALAPGPITMRLLHRELDLVPGRQPLDLWSRCYQRAFFFVEPGPLSR
jgi:hypothetical protein